MKNTCLLWLLFAAMCLAQPIPVSFVEMNWGRVPLYPGSAVSSDFISGVLVNSSSVPLVTPIVFFSVYSRSGTLLGDAGPAIVQTVAPGTRWAFSVPVMIDSFSLTPAYAKVGRSFCFITNGDGQRLRVDLTPNDSPQILSPDEVELQSRIAANRALAVEKEFRTMESAFRKTHPCPTTNKLTRSCKGYTISFRLGENGRVIPDSLAWKARNQIDR